MSESESDEPAVDLRPLPRQGQLFLQAAMSRRAFSDSTGEAMYKRACAITGVSVGSYANMLSEIKKALEPFGLLLREHTDGEGAKWHSFVNTEADDVAKLATDFKPNELTFFRQMVERIIQAPGKRYCVTRSEAFDIATAMKPAFTRSDAQSLLASLVLKGWLHRDVDRNIYTLSPRSLAELETYINNTFEEDLEGTTCRKCPHPVFEGLQCPNGECEVRYHPWCYAKAISGVVAPKCPECSTAWPTGKGRPIGIAAMQRNNGNANSDEEQSAAPRNRKSAGGRKSAAAAAVVSSSAAKSRPKGKAIPVAASSDAQPEEEDELAGARTNWMTSY